MRKTVFKITAAFLILAALLCLPGCSEDKVAKQNLSEMLDTLKEGKYVDALTKYVAHTDSGYDFLHSGNNFTKDDFPAYDMHMAVFKSLKYNIKKTKIIGETEIHFITDISTIDLVPVGKELAQMTAAYNISSENAEEDEKLSDSEINDILSQQMLNISSEYLKRDDIKERKTEVEVIMYYDVNSGWLVYMDEPLADALSGGVYEAYYSALKDADMVTK